MFDSERSGYGKSSEFSLENEVFKPFFLQQPGKTWEYFCDFIAAVAEHVSCAMCMHCGKFSVISLRPLPESCECAMCACIVGKFLQFRCGHCRVCELCCVHALWENFHDFVAAIAGIM